MLDHTNETFFKNIKKLPSASSAFFNESGFKIARYWDFDVSDEYSSAIDEKKATGIPGSFCRFGAAKAAKRCPDRIVPFGRIGFFVGRLRGGQIAKT